MTTPWVEQLNPISGHTIANALALVERAADHDGSRAISEQALLRLRHDSEAMTTYAAIGTTGFDGFALVHDSVAELVVDPAARHRGIGGALVERILSAPSAPAFWAHGAHPDAIALAAAHELKEVRRLWQMSMPLTSLPPVELPDATTIRTFVVGQDEAMWLELNAKAFASHPEQGVWSLDDLLAREAEPWFDAAGFLIAERAGQPVGFHWTKVHVPGELGEVYIVGVDPSAQGGGLGRALTLAGLHHLQSRGIATVMLFVDEINTAAIRVYERLGFTHAHTDICFVR